MPVAASVALLAALTAALATAGLPDAKPIPPGERLDPSARQVVQRFLGYNALPIPTLAPRLAREQYSPGDAAREVASRQGKPTVEPVGRTSHIRIPGPGGPLLARVYTPSGRGPFPVVVYFHGGGWVVANINVYDSSARALTNAARSIVVSVAYRQAPENKFPAAAMDAYASSQWVMRNAASLGGIPSRVSVAGESAGGNLATVAAMMARDRGGRMPTHQLLVYPVTNYAFNTQSYRTEAKDVPLDRATMRWFWGHYLRTPADGRNPYASPLRAGSLRGMPPATIIIASEDPLRSEGEAYGQRLRADGVQVQVTRYSGVMHEFFGMGAVIPKAKQAVAVAGQRLRAAQPAG